MYCATWVQVMAFMPPRNEHSNTPPRPNRMPISNCAPVSREAIRPMPCDHIGERAQRRRRRKNDLRPAPVKAQTEIVGHGVQVQLAKVRRDQQGHQAEPAGPTQHVCQSAGLRLSAREPLQIEAAGHADERSRAHPVGGGGHAVVHRWDAAARHVILFRIRGAAMNPDGRIHHHRGEQEYRAEPEARQPALFGPCHQ